MSRAEELHKVTSCWLRDFLVTSTPLCDPEEKAKAGCLFNIQLGSKAQISATIRPPRLILDSKVPVPGLSWREAHEHMTPFRTFHVLKTLLSSGLTFSSSLEESNLAVGWRWSGENQLLPALFSFRPIASCINFMPCVPWSCRFWNSKPRISKLITFFLIPLSLSQFSKVYFATQKLSFDSFCLWHFVLWYRRGRNLGRRNTSVNISKYYLATPGTPTGYRSYFSWLTSAVNALLEPWSFSWTFLSSSYNPVELCSHYWRIIPDKHKTGAFTLQILKCSPIQLFFTLSLFFLQTWISEHLGEEGKFDMLIRYLVHTEGF